MSLQLQISTNPQVESLIQSYPEIARDRLMHLRNLIFESAAEIEGLHHLEETLKWGEPSYITKKAAPLEWTGKLKRPINMHYTLAARPSWFLLLSKYSIQV